MPEEGTGQELAPLNSRLSRWISARSITSQRELDAFLLSPTTASEYSAGIDLYEPELTQPRQVTLSRIRSLIREELSSGWRQERTSDQPAEFPIVIRLHCASGSAFDAAPQMSTLDMVVRRADAVVRTLIDEAPRGYTWPRPSRPDRCGLLVVDAAPGSLDLVFTVYGSLVVLAESSPVALAAMSSLIWDATKTARRIGSNWLGRAPRPNGSIQEFHWHEETMRKMMPVMLSAVERGVGFQLESITANGDSFSFGVPEARPKSLAPTELDLPEIP